jgi:Arc/MetJ-type ribon-helix-helix transcriptional regulator
MGKCAAYWRALDNGKDCGAPKAGTNTEKNQYIYRHEIVPDLVAMGLLEDDVFENLPYSVGLCNKSYVGERGRAKTINLGALRRDSPIRKKMLDFIFERIASGKRVSGSDLVNAGFERTSWTIVDYERHYSSGAAGIRGLLSERGPSKKSERGTSRAITSLKNKPVLSRGCFSSNGRQISLTSKKQILVNLCSVGQLAILERMAAAGHGDEEYAAFCIAIKWAAERLDVEKIAKDVQT